MEKKLTPEGLPLVTSDALVYFKNGYISDEATMDEVEKELKENNSGLYIWLINEKAKDESIYLRLVGLYKLMSIQAPLSGMRRLPEVNLEAISVTTDLTRRSDFFKKIYFKRLIDSSDVLADLISEDLIAKTQKDRTYIADAMGKFYMLLSMAVKSTYSKYDRKERDVPS